MQYFIAKLLAKSGGKLIQAKSLKSHMKKNIQVWFIYRTICPEPYHIPCKEEFSCIHCQLSWNTWEIFCAESPAQTPDPSRADPESDAHWCSPLLSLSHEPPGNSWFSVPGERWVWFQAGSWQPHGVTLQDHRPKKSLFSTLGYTGREGRDGSHDSRGKHKENTH